MSHQVSVFLENKLGSIEKVTAVLSAAQIDIRSLHLNHTANGWGVLNLVVSDPEEAQRRLSAQGMASALREIAVVEMPDRPGGLDELLKSVVRAGVSFTNAYGHTIRDGESAFFVIDIQDMPEARERLRAIGLRILDDSAVYGPRGKRQ
ncbi:ACT domain-containing protein [Dentiradicibacter hellwigii]|uniref:ACT domain-containing protein n=1 Tax=Dentiradicibacter hellwigii TaxID=3149053 RepID=A0ABV4UFZ7_9RHOO